jgi:hypothetical protein
MHRKVAVGAAIVGLCAGGGAIATAATSSAPSKANVVAVTSAKVKVNRYLQDELRWKKDVYTVKSGGTVHVLNLAADEGPHTFSVVKAKDLPKTVPQMFNCKVCEAIGKALGANPETEDPPPHFYLENGVAQDTVPNLDKPGDTAFIPPQKNYKVDLKVTAKKGTTLNFLCAIHPWMQAKVLVK